jgi:Co/Zn/Cd efflux system component
MVDLVVLVGFLLMFLIGVIWSLLIKKSLFWGAIIDGALIGFIGLWIGLVIVRFATEQQVHGGLVFAVGLAAFVAAWSVYALFAKAQNASFVATHGVGFVIGVLAFVLSGFLHFQPTPKPAEPVKQERVLTPAEIEKKAFEQAAWQAYRDMLRQLKAQLHDPKSYKEVSVTNHKYGDKIRIRIQFRANNAFGVPRLHSALGEADKNGNNMRIIEVN